MTYKSVVSVVFLASVLLGGCAFTDQKVELEFQPREVNEKAALGSLYFSKLSDARADKSRVGVVKNSWGSETASVRTDQDLTILVSKAIVSELKNIGYKVSTVDINRLDVATGYSPEIPMISGNLSKLFAEPIVGFWAGDVTGEIQLTLEVKKHNKVERKTYRASEKVTVMAWTASSYKESLEKTLQSLLLQIRSDFTTRP